MCGCVCLTGHIKDPMPLIKKNRTSYPGGRLPPSFIQVIFTGMNKLYDYVLALKMALDADRVKPPLKLKLKFVVKIKNPRWLPNSHIGC